MIEGEEKVVLLVQLSRQLYLYLQVRKKHRFPGVDSLLQTELCSRGRLQSIEVRQCQVETCSNNERGGEK